MAERTDDVCQVREARRTRESGRETRGKMAERTDDVCQVREQEERERAEEKAEGRWPRGPMTSVR